MKVITISWLFEVDRNSELLEMKSQSPKAGSPKQSKTHQIYIYIFINIQGNSQIKDLTLKNKNIY